MKGLFLTLALLLASGCATTSSTFGRRSQWIEPMQAVQLAAAAAPDGVPGVFALQVQATGMRGGISYLDSELDYRDQRNLTIAIAPAAARKLEVTQGSHPAAAFKGKRILVNGVAIRTKIVFFAGGRATDKYYYQTQVQVTDPGQITIRP